MLFILCFSTAIYGIRLVNELPGRCHFFVTQSGMRSPGEAPSMHRSVLQDRQPKWLFFTDAKRELSCFLFLPLK